MPQKVLLIDDSPAIHALVRARLQEEPLALHFALGGEEGLSIAEQLHPDLILLDVDMPAPDGLEVCWRLKSNPSTHEIPIIFLTGATAAADKVWGLELGAVDYVTKPFNAFELRVRVATALRAKFIKDLLDSKGQIDGLTGLWNEAYFEERLHQEQSLARRSPRPLSCLLIDVDKLNSLNKRLGYSLGDEVLRRMGVTLGESARAEDVVCRLRGGKFGVLCPNTDTAGAQTLAYRLRAKFAGLNMRHRDEALVVTCCMGIAEFYPDQPLPHGAEEALAEAKRIGGDQIILSPPREAAVA